MATYNVGIKIASVKGYENVGSAAANTMVLLKTFGANEYMQVSIAGGSGVILGAISGIFMDGIAFRSVVSSSTTVTPPPQFVYSDTDNGAGLYPTQRYRRVFLPAMNVIIGPMSSLQVYISGMSTANYDARVYGPTFVNTI